MMTILSKVESLPLIHQHYPTHHLLLWGPTWNPAPISIHRASRSITQRVIHRHSRTNVMNVECDASDIRVRRTFQRISVPGWIFSPEFSMELAGKVGALPAGSRAAGGRRRRHQAGHTVRRSRADLSRRRVLARWQEAAGR